MADQAARDPAILKELEEQKKLVKQLKEEIAKLKAPIKIKPAILQKQPTIVNESTDTITVFYLPKVLKQGPSDGSAPIPAAVAERSVELRVLSEPLRAVEQRLNAVVYAHPRGDGKIDSANDAKWREALLPLLVGKDAAKAVSGGGFRCSGDCLNEEEGNYKFVEKARFKLSGCVHHSHHVQCLLTLLLLNDTCYTGCHIYDTPQCRCTPDAQGKYGQANYWAPEDYANFTKAFLRSRALVDAFLLPKHR